MSYLPKLPVPNPWHDLPHSAPFVLPADARAIDCWDSKSNGVNRILPPQPYVGRLNRARVVLLALNPGDGEDGKTWGLLPKEYRSEWLRALTFETTLAFFLLDERFAQEAGGRWWRRRVKGLFHHEAIPPSQSPELRRLTERLMCIEWFPYKSKSSIGSRSVPSQAYTFALVREAIRLQKQIVIMRAERLWFASVPELHEADVVRCSNVQNPALSKNQFEKRTFSRIRSLLLD